MRKILILMLTLLFPLLACTLKGNNAYVDNFPNSFLITDYVEKRSSSARVYEAILFTKESDITDEFFELPNHAEPAVFFEENSLIYVLMSNNYGDKLSPITFSIVDGKLELVFTCLEQTPLLTALYISHFGISVPKKYLNMDFNSILIRIFSLTRFTYGNNFFGPSGKVVSLNEI